MSRKFLKDVSVSTLQVVINQLLGFIVFLLTSVHLPKEDYGELNWSFAIFTFCNTLLSLRLEQIVVKRAAQYRDPSPIMTVFLFHVLITGAGFYFLLLILSFIFPYFFGIHHLLLIVGISQFLSFITLPFKQVANGKERFDYLAIMSSINNLARSVLLLILVAFSDFTINTVLIIFIIGSFIELLVCYFLTRYKMGIRLSVHTSLSDYKLLLRESVHQMGAAVLMAGITRIDWILLGLFTSSIVTAEYTFAYRVYELSPFPLLIIAPVLLSRFSRYFGKGSDHSIMPMASELRFLIRMEMIAATFIPLVLNVIWTPLMDYLTGSKYGSVNAFTFLILSLCIPFQYITNIIWSAHFAQNKLKLIFRITLFTFCVVVGGDLIFIPLFGVKGAAFVYLASIIAEYINYMRSSELSAIRETWQSLLICLISAVIAGFTAYYLINDSYSRLIVAIPLYLILLLLSSQLRFDDFKFFVRIIKNQKTSVTY